MINYPNIDPVALKVGPIGSWEGFSIRWYGLTYLIGILLAFFYCWTERLKVTPTWSTDEIVDLFFYGVLGVIFGGTIGYVFFYDPNALLEDPLRLFRFWEAGRSFHGGLLGVLLAIYLYGKRHKRRFLSITDYIAPAVPLGLGAGRIGNFLNGELWGRTTDAAWGMVFPHAGPLARHPSQLYEFFLEGVVLFILLFIYTRKPRPLGRASALFAIVYGLARFVVEFFREPDLTLGFLALNWITMGQILSLPMIIFGIWLWVVCGRKDLESSSDENIKNKSIKKGRSL